LPYHPPISNHTIEPAHGARNNDARTHLNLAQNDWGIARMMIVFQAIPNHGQPGNRVLVQIFESELEFYNLPVLEPEFEGGQVFFEAR